MFVSAHCFLHVCFGELGEFVGASLGLSVMECKSGRQCKFGYVSVCSFGGLVWACKFENQSHCVQYRSARSRVSGVIVRLVITFFSISIVGIAIS